MILFPQYPWIVEAVGGRRGGDEVGVVVGDHGGGRGRDGIGVGGVTSASGGRDTRLVLQHPRRLDSHFDVF